MKNEKQYNLENKTLNFAINCHNFTKNLKKSFSNVEYIKQLIRSSASVAANYIEANEAISKKDFIFRIKICRKEIKESRLWLNLIETNNIHEQNNLIQESTELMKIF